MIIRVQIRRACRRSGLRQRMPPQLAPRLSLYRTGRKTKLVSMQGAASTSLKA